MINELEEIEKLENDEFEKKISEIVCYAAEMNVIKISLIRSFSFSPNWISICLENVSLDDNRIKWIKENFHYTVISQLEKILATNVVRPNKHRTPDLYINVQIDADLISDIRRIFYNIFDYSEIIFFSDPTGNNDIISSYSPTLFQFHKNEPDFFFKHIIKNAEYRRKYVSKG
jgi:hypothetical protein